MLFKLVSAKIVHVRLGAKSDGTTDLDLGGVSSRRVRLALPSEAYEVHDEVRREGRDSRGLLVLGSAAKSRAVLLDFLTQREFDAIMKSSDGLRGGTDMALQQSLGIHTSGGGFILVLEALVGVYHAKFEGGLNRGATIFSGLHRFIKSGEDGIQVLLRVLLGWTCFWFWTTLFLEFEHNL